jgi:hypothetical protein
LGREEALLNLRERTRRVGLGLSVLAGLSSSERQVFAECWWALLACRLRLAHRRWLASPQFLAAEPRETKRSAPTRQAFNEASLLRVFRLALRTHVVAVSCLPRSLALRRVLLKHGWPCRLEVGMRRSLHGLEGHAWLERNGQVVGGGDSFVHSFHRFERAA